MRLRLRQDSVCRRRLLIIPKILSVPITAILRRYSINSRQPVRHSMMSVKLPRRQLPPPKKFRQRHKAKRIKSKRSRNAKWSRQSVPQKKLSSRQNANRPNFCLNLKNSKKSKPHQMLRKSRAKHAA